MVVKQYNSVLLKDGRRAAVMKKKNLNAHSAGSMKRLCMRLYETAEQEGQNGKG